MGLDVKPACETTGRLLVAGHVGSGHPGGGTAKQRDELRGLGGQRRAVTRSLSTLHGIALLWGTMRRSVRITFTALTAAALAACGRRAPDPCAAATFSQQACQDAVHGGGYYWNGRWYPMMYRNPYPFYYDAYRSYQAGGGTSSAVPASAYGQPAGGVERGGFGATGEGHGASGDAPGAGE